MTDTLGRKFDSGKPRMALLPPLATESVAHVLTFGAKKYAKDNWKYVDDAHDRYLDASLRHINAYIRGELNDTESNLPHLAHSICCLMFILDLDLAEKQQEVYKNDVMQRIVDSLSNFERKPETTFPTPGWKQLQEAMTYWNKKEVA
jgi:hypothetical protein